MPTVRALRGIRHGSRDESAWPVFPGSSPGLTLTPAPTYCTPLLSMSVRSIQPGHGRIVVRNDGFSNVFSELSAAYPLKLLSPQLPSSNVSVVYMLSYGGGLVGGDQVQVDVEVLNGARLALLSQVIGHIGSFRASCETGGCARAPPKCSRRVPAGGYLRERKRTPLRCRGFKSMYRPEVHCFCYRILSLASLPRDITKRRSSVSPRIPQPSSLIGSLLDASHLEKIGHSQDTIA